MMAAFWFAAGLVVGVAVALVVMIVIASALDPSVPGDAMSKENRND